MPTPHSRAATAKVDDAAAAIPAATKVFTERPIVVAEGSGAAAVAKALTKLDRASEDFEAVSQLHSRFDRAAALPGLQRYELTTPHHAVETGAHGCRRRRF